MSAVMGAEGAAALSDGSLLALDRELWRERMAVEREERGRLEALEGELTGMLAEAEAEQRRRTEALAHFAAPFPHLMRTGRGGRS